MEENQNKNIFEEIKHIDGDIEYWFARELQEVLEYKEWRFFEKVIKNAIINCKNSDIKANYHFGVYSKMIDIGKGGKRKGLRYREDILDNMGSEELAANFFRITQTEAKLKRDNIQGEGNANKVHNKIGKIVRGAIKKSRRNNARRFANSKEKFERIR